MRPIPDKLRKKLSNMPHMEKCAWCVAKSNLEWHHAILYSGRQLNEWYAIIALCRQCHRGEFGTLRAEIKDFCEMLAITRGLEDLTKKYPKRNWVWEKQWFEQKIKRYMNDKKI